MEERICPHCGMASPANGDGKCPHCGGDMTAAPEAAEPVPETAPAVSPGEPLPTVTQAPPPAVAPPPPPMPTPQSPLADGQFRCPHCGEALYAGEQVCWNCGKRVDEPVAETEAAPTEMPAETPVPPADIPAAPVAVPVTAAAEPPPALGWDDMPLAGDKPVPSPEVMSLSYWSLGLGIVSLLTCGMLSILAPIALWLGVKARREGGDTVATVGLVLGIIGTLVFMVVVVTVILMIIGVIANPAQALAPMSLWCA